MRGYLLALLLSLIPASVAAGPAADPYNGWQHISIGEWGGLNLLNDSSNLGSDAQVANNVLTDSGYLEMRPGSTLLTSILPGYPTVYVNDWQSPNGTRYLIAQASNTVYRTDFSPGGLVALFTAAAGYNIDTQPAFSKLFFADGFHNLWCWDGNSTGTRLLSFWVMT